MEPTATPNPKLGLRERKKQRTRQTILTAAFDLFAQRGYAHTTLEDIAEAAEVSTGTLFAYFPSKEEILFPEEREFYEQLKQNLVSRAPEATAFDVLRDLLPTIRPPDETFELRLKILREERLRDRQRARYLGVEHLLAGAIAEDLATPPDDLRATLLAAATTAALVSVGESLQPGSAEAISYEHALSILEQMFSALYTGPTPPQAATRPTHRRRSGSKNPR
jgi:AcrR family transcriptional regulator